MKKNNISEKTKMVEKELRDNSKLEVKKLFEKFQTSYEGISIVESDERLEKYGKNTIEIKNENTIWHKLKEAFINPFNIVLMMVAAITFFTDVVIATQKDYATFILIVSTVLISAIISLKEQTKYQAVGHAGNTWYSHD